MAKNTPKVEFTRDDIVTLRDSKEMTFKAIAELLSLHPITVAKLYRVATVPQTGVRPTVTRVKRDRGKGMSIALIATRYGITKKVVKELLAA